MLFTHARKVDLNYVWILYVNQLLNAAVKMFILWRLSKQKWANRGNQKAGFAEAGWVPRLREWMAAYLTTLSFATLALATVVYTQILSVPSWATVEAILFH